MSFVLEQFWLLFCGNDVMQTTNLYWEFFVDATLVAGSYFMPRVLRKSSNPEGVVEFSLLYFSLINGWFLYAHQYASRFREVSRLHWLLVWLFILSMLYGVTHASFETYRSFSEAMIFMRFSIFLMLSRVACYVDRAQPISALLAVFIGDAILCFALSAASDVESAAILWGFVAITELHVDLFLAVGLRGPLQIPYRLENVIDRFYAVLLAPIGAILIDAFCHTKTNEEWLYIFSSLVLMTLFGMLFMAFKNDVVNHMRLRSHFEKASLLILLKLLGYTLWTIGACLLDEPNLHRQSFVTNVMGYMVGAALFCFLNLRSLAGRRHNVVEGIWFAFSVAPFLLPHFIKDSTPLVFLSIHVILVSILNMIETWHNFEQIEFLQLRHSADISNVDTPSELEPLLRIPERNANSVASTYSAIVV
ncbi:hypothetical protein IV203_020863 [Nitzschia inconspicua]|uniref:Uncharacterized protein n=1 Tax=Nitzschia inconspicua TaxID=303405 RepID=A0A9K3KH82_9STRA|nr:hypothetical protein IV203_020863 [Nitzschia inconspicua]